MTLAAVSLRTNTVSLFSFCTDGCTGHSQVLQTVRAWKLGVVIYGEFHSHLICRCTGGLVLFTVSFGAFSMLPSSHICSKLKIFYGFLKGDWRRIDGPVCLQSRLGPHCECVAHCVAQGVTTKSSACRAMELINHCRGKFNLKALTISDLHQVAKVFFFLSLAVFWFWSWT